MLEPSGLGRVVISPLACSWNGTTAHETDVACLHRLALCCSIHLLRSLIGHAAFALTLLDNSRLLSNTHCLTHAMTSIAKSLQSLAKGKGERLYRLNAMYRLNAICFSVFLLLHTSAFLFLCIYRITEFWYSVFPYFCYSALLK